MKNWKILQLGTIITAFAMIVSLGNGLNVWAAGSSGKISLSKASISVKEGITEKITVKNKPEGAKISWSSKNTRQWKVLRVKIKQNAVVILGHDLKAHRSELFKKSYILYFGADILFC